MSDKLLGSVTQKINQKKKELDRIKEFLEEDAERSGRLGPSIGHCYKQSQRNFHECLDILGGVAFRERTLRTNPSTSISTRTSYRWRRN